MMRDGIAHKIRAQIGLGLHCDHLLTARRTERSRLLQTRPLGPDSPTHFIGSENGMGVLKLNFLLC